jgi:polysaccharide biosynthesis protein PslH
MRILVLSPKPPWPPHDGGAVATMRCIEGLVAGGALVSVMSIRTEKHHPYPDHSLQPTASLEHYDNVTVNTRVRPVRLLANLFFSKEPYDLIRFHSWKYSGALLSLLAVEQFDIIQCEGLPFSYYVEEIRSATSSTIVLRAHNVEHRIREMMADAASGTFKKGYLKNLAGRIKKREIFAARQFDAIVPISEPDFKWFRSESPDKPIILSETGVDITEPADTDSNSLRVGFIGALNWQPNIDGLKWFLAGVWPRTTGVVPDATFHIAGRGASRSVKEGLCGKNVFFEGEVDDARRFTDSMAVMIAPLFAGSGLRIKIIEAMSLGKTVVATPVAASGLPVEDKRELLIGKDVKSFSDALVSALRNPGVRTETGTRARELVKNRFNNLEQTSALLEFYKKLCNGC